MRRSHGSILEWVSKKQDWTADWKSLCRHLLGALEKGILPCIHQVLYLPAENSHATWSAEWSSTYYMNMRTINVITTLHKNITKEQLISFSPIVPMDKWIILTFKSINQKILNCSLRLMFASQLCFFPLG